MKLRVLALVTVLALAASASFLVQGCGSSSSTTSNGTTTFLPNLNP